MRFLFIKSKISLMDYLVLMGEPKQIRQAAHILT